MTWAALLPQILQAHPTFITCCHLQIILAPLDKRRAGPWKAFNLPGFSTLFLFEMSLYFPVIAAMD